MTYKYPLSQIAITLFFVGALNASALDVVNFSATDPSVADRDLYRTTVLDAAFKATEPEFGEYEINYKLPLVSRHRALFEVSKGDVLNSYMMVHYNDWHQKAQIVPVPVLRGLLSYRLILVDEKNLDVFSNVRSVEDLKKLRVGSLSVWGLTRILESQGYNVVKAGTHDTLFKMLAFGRFDYLLRGVNEVFDELEQPGLVPKSIVIAPDIAVFLPMPIFTYVSLKTPRLGERLDIGMRRIADNGYLEKMMEEFYADNIARAKLSERRMLNIENTELPSELFGDPAHWLDFDEEEKPQTEKPQTEKP